MNLQFHIFALFQTFFFTRQCWHGIYATNSPSVTTLVLHLSARSDDWRYALLLVGDMSLYLSVNISGQIPGWYLKIGQGCFMPWLLLSHDSWSCSSSVRSYATSLLDTAVSYYLILYLYSSVICHLLSRNFKKIRKWKNNFMTRSWRIYPRSRKGQIYNLSEHHTGALTYMWAVNTCIACHKLQYL